MKVKVIDRNLLKTLRPEINEALKAVGDKYGIMFEFNNIRFDSTSFSTKLNANIKDSQKPSFGFTPVGGSAKGLPSIGTRFKAGRNHFIITGYKMNRPKYPILAKQEGSGRMFKFTVSQVMNAI